MVRDLESLIEYLYLKATRSDLLERDFIVNPTSSDNIFGKVCIINKVYDVPDLRTASFVIDRRKDLYKTGRNPYIRGVDIYQDDVFVMPIKNIFYFGKVPESLLNYGECYKYLNNQLTDSIKALPI
jgi:hypothetical protein